MSELLADIWLYLTRHMRRTAGCDIHSHPPLCVMEGFSFPPSPAGILFPDHVVHLLTEREEEFGKGVWRCGASERELQESWIKSLTSPSNRLDQNSPVKHLLLGNMNVSMMMGVMTLEEIGHVK